MSEVSIEAISGDIDSTNQVSDKNLDDKDKKQNIELKKHRSYAILGIICLIVVSYIVVIFMLGWEGKSGDFSLSTYEFAGFSGTIILETFAISIIIANHLFPGKE